MKENLGGFGIFAKMLTYAFFPFIRDVKQKVYWHNSVTVELQFFSYFFVIADQRVFGIFP